MFKRLLTSVLLIPTETKKFKGTVSLESADTMGNRPKLRHAN